MNRFKMGLFVLMSAPALVWQTSGQCQAGLNPYDKAMKQVRVLSESPHVRLLPFGESHAGRAIPAFVISDFSQDASKKARILICAGQHGDEYNPVRSILSLCKELSSGKQPELLSRCAIVVAPVVNPDGTAESRRANAQGRDVNRDWMALKSREAQYVHGIIKRWKPHVLIDVHEWIGAAPVTRNGIEVPRCPLISQEKAVGDLARQVARQAGLTRIPCSAHSDKRLFHRRYALLGYATYLLETGPGQDYAAKDRAYKSAVATMARALAENQATWAKLSPASKRFDVAAVSAYLEPVPIGSGNSACSALPLTVLMLGIYCLLVWVMKPLGRKDETTWSRRFRRCLVDGELETHPLLMRHTLCPITLKSWINRRIRVRYTPPAQDKNSRSVSTMPAS